MASKPSGTSRARSTAAAKPAATTAKSTARTDRDKELTAKVLKLRDDEGKTWGQIGDALGITGGKAAFLHLCANVKPKDRIKHDGTDADAGAKVVKARDTDHLAYHVIAARMGIPESRVKTLYVKTSGKPLSPIPGLGGRTAANGSKPAAKKTGTAAKKAGTQAKAGRARQTGSAAKGGATRRGGTGRRGSSRPQKAAK